jgi:dihydropteroate synthase
MRLIARGREIGFPRRPLIMGILNINDDSFSGDGRLDPVWALNRAAELTSLGADIIDVGAESARTNRGPITGKEEIRRLVPFIEGFDGAVAAVQPRDAVQVYPPLLSINTWRPEVAGPVMQQGGHILNDMGALPDSANALICANTGAALLIMHSLGAPKEKHTHVGYEDVMASLTTFFREKLAMAEEAGVPWDSTILDPGIDFAKQAPDNLRILRETGELTRLGRPVLLPISRKSVIGRVLGISDPIARDPGTAACLVAGTLRGASIFRVHHVEMAWRVLVSMDKLAADKIGRNEILAGD